jgi:hypothetical protein
MALRLALRSLLDMGYQVSSCAGDTYYCSVARVLCRAFRPRGMHGGTEFAVQQHMCVFVRWAASLAVA